MVSMGQPLGIFIISAPLITQAVKLELPQASSQVNDLRPEKIEFAVDAAGLLYWNGEPVSRAVASQRFEAEGRQQRSPKPTCAPTRRRPTASSRRRRPMHRRPA